MLRTDETEFLSSPEAEADGVLDAEERETEGEIENGDSAGTVIVDTLRTDVSPE